MRKNQLKLIKKTERWLHRKKGEDSFVIPPDIDTAKITRFVILGSCAGEENGTLLGVGNYDESSGSYVIGIHAHGKNLLSCLDFAAAHTEKQICTSIKPALTADKFAFIPDSDKVGTPIIDKSMVKFKEKTAYTLAFTAAYITTTKPRDLKITFNYTDGTSYTPIYDSAIKNITDCQVTDPEKTLAYISSYVAARSMTIYIIQDFGLYEGAYTVHEEVHEPYVGARSKITLDAPLYSIGYASDELDLKSGTLLRKIERLHVDSSVSVSQTDTEGVFRIDLDAPMRHGGRIISPYGEITDGCDCGLSASDDGCSLFFMPPGNLMQTDEVESYLAQNPFDVFYVLRTPKQQTLEVLCPELNGTTAVDILTDTAPRKCFVEYY